MIGQRSGYPETRGFAYERNDAGNEDEDREATQRVGLEGSNKRPSKQMRHGMAQPAARAGLYAEPAEEAPLHEPFGCGVRRRECDQPGGPDKGFRGEAKRAQFAVSHSHSRQVISMLSGR